MLPQPLCPPCKTMTKILDALQNKYLIETEDFNVREDMSVAKKYGAERMPFLVFFRDRRADRKPRWSYDGRRSVACLRVLRRCFGEK